jgi:hypothetical protein
VQPVRVSVQPVHVIPVAHITPVHSSCMPPSSHAQSGNYLYCHPTHPSHRSVLTAWCRSLRPTSVGARHTHPIEVSVAENSSPHRSLPAAVSTKNQQHVCRLSRSCAMDAGRRCPARHWYVCPIALVLQPAPQHALQHNTLCNMPCAVVWPATPRRTADVNHALALAPCRSAALPLLPQIPLTPPSLQPPTRLNCTQLLVQHYTKFS